ncbi:hypothetical protein ACM66B_004191 [Microbotryomycetes sp. NB124-2]
MVAAFSTAVLGAATQQQAKPQQHVRQTSSSASSDSEDGIEYAEELHRQRQEPRTTKQKVDRRAPSTYWKKSLKEQTWSERFLRIATTPPEIHYLKDEKADRGPVQTIPLLPEHIFVLRHAVIPLTVHALIYTFMPNLKWPFYVAYPFYLLCFSSFSQSMVARCNDFATKYGALDEKNIGRDRVPDMSVSHIVRSAIAYVVVRTGIDFYLHYDKMVMPFTDITWSFPLRLCAWLITLDYFFYCYHRSSHEVDALWFIHQRHHVTKHPIAILALLADDWQEFLEIFAVPLLASLVVPLSFSEMWITLYYTIYIEMAGHSGVRASWTHPVLFWLKAFDMELAVEDHDIHHRFGKSGRNYGKQTRVFDKLFGTTAERIETFSHSKSINKYL